MKNHLRTIGSVRESTIDGNTGEVIDHSVVKHSIMVGKKEDFFLCYTALLSVFKDISGPAIKVYSYLLLHHKPGTAIVINKFIKTQMLEFMASRSLGTINNTLAELCKVTLLYKEPSTNAVYYINPRYAFKGSNSERNQGLKVIIELGCEDC